MPANQGISSHGTTIFVRPSIADPSGASLWAAGDSIEITEIGDITMPGLTKNEFDITPHNRNIDNYHFGVLRRNLVTFPTFFNAAILSHKVLRALELDNNVNTNMENEFTVSSPDGETWLFSGGVKDMAEAAPVDGTKTVTTSIRMTGPFFLNGVEYGL